MDRSEHLASILADWRARSEEGESLAPEEVVRRHPMLADELREQFAAIEMIDARFGTHAAIPTRIGEFRILREIGRGGMGIVYEAEQPSMRRRVALKVLLPSIIASRKAVERFQREAQAAGSLKHTNIVAVHQLGQDGGIWFSAMELVEGRPLSEVIDDLRKARRAPSKSDESTGLTRSRSGSHAYYVRVAEMFAGVAEALQVAHENGVIHRDIKPSNLLLDAEGELRIVDFGLARLDDAAEMTITGDFLGTPSYMSPEQVLGTSALDARTDVYALGATLYEAFVLRPPFVAPTVPALIQKILRQDPPSPRRRDRGLPRDLETITLKAIEKDPGQRFQSAGEMAQELRRFAQGSAIRARPIGPVGRAWRVVKRNKVRSGLVAAVLVATLVASLAIGAARRASDQRHRLEYAALCRDADLAAVREWGIHESELSEMERTGRSYALYTEAIAHSPDRWQAHLGRAFSRIGNLDQSLRDVEAARTRGLPDRTAHLARAFLHSEGHLGPQSPKDAARELELARALPETHALDAYLEGRALHGLRRWKEAEQVLTRGLERASGDQGPMRWLALFRRAMTRERLGDWAGALSDFGAARELVGDRSLETRMRIASYWWRLEQADRATKELEQVITEAEATGIPEISWWGIAAAAVQSGETAWLDRISKAAFEAHPDSALLLGVRFDILMDRVGDRKAALALVEETDERALESYVTHANRARAQMALRRNEEALESIARALELGGPRQNLLVNRAVALTMLGRHDEAMEAVDAALRAAPDFAPALAQKAQILIVRGEVDAALPVARRAVEAARPESMGWARFVLARAMQLKGDLDDALIEVDRSIEANDVHADAHWIRGEILRAKKAPEEALAAFERAIELDPLHDPAHQGRALALGNDLQRHDAAVAAWQALVALPHVKERADAHLYIGNTHQSRGEWADAVRAFKRSLDAEAVSGIDRGFVTSCMASCLAKLGRFPEAIAAAEDALRLSGSHPSVLTNAAATYQDAQQLDKALPLLERALELAPHLHPAKFNLAQVRFDLGDGPGALEAIEAYVESVPADPNGWFERGRVLIDLLRRPAEAIPFAERALELGGNPLLCNLLLGNAYLQLYESDKALSAYEKVLALKPGLFPAVVNRALILASVGTPDEVRKGHADFERILAAEKHPIVMTMYARCLAVGPHKELRDPKKAEVLAQGAVELVPGDADLRNTLGVALGAVGKWAASIEQLEAASKARDGGNGVDWIYLALAHAHLGQVERAEAYRAKAERWIDEHNPKSLELRRARAAIAAMLD